MLDPRTHLSDSLLLGNAAKRIGNGCVEMAELLMDIVEIDARRLYAPAGYPSIHSFCMGEWHLSEDAAYKRIQAARAAQSFPVLFEVVAENRLHLAAVCLLAPHLTPENADELVAAATHQSKAAIERMLRARGPAEEDRRGGLCLSLAPGQVEPGAAEGPGQCFA